VQDQVAGNVKPDAATFGNVLQPLANVENIIALEGHILGFYKAVSFDSKLRDASREAQKLLDDFAIETAMREDLYKLVDAVLKRKEDLDQESCLLLDKTHKDYIRNGLRLPVGYKRDRFKEVKKRLIQLSIEFRKNQIEEAGGVWFTPQELEGVPEDVLAGLEKGEGENDGLLRLTFKYPDLIPTLRYAKNSETRKRFYIANENKCKQNVPIFKEVMVLRDEAARLLGYPNHATFRIEDKMAKKPKAVDDFLGDLRSRMVTGGQREIEKLKELKKADLESRGQPFDDHYFFWDHGFYNRLMLEKQYSVDQQKIAEYFPLQTTIRGMLEIFQNLFGLVFVEITGDKRDKLAESGKGSDIVWHEDVQVFSTWDDSEQGSGFLGYLYLDLFPREGKDGHPSNYNLQPVCMMSI
jgi:metallopeptidase MepB